MSACVPAFHLFPHLTAAENVMLAPTGSQVSRRSARDRRPRCLLKWIVGKDGRLSERALRWPAQRVAIARSLACDQSASMRRNHLGARPRTGQRMRAWSAVAASSYVSRTPKGASRATSHKLVFCTTQVHEEGFRRKFRRAATPELQHSWAMSLTQTASRYPVRAARESPPCWPCQLSLSKTCRHI